MDFMLGTSSWANTAPTNCVTLHNAKYFDKASACPGGKGLSYGSVGPKP